MRRETEITRSKRTFLGPDRQTIRAFAYIASVTISFDGERLVFSDEGTVRDALLRDLSPTSRLSRSCPREASRYFI